MKPTETSYWVWLPIAVLLVAGCLLIVFFAPQRLLNHIVPFFFYGYLGAVVLLMISMITRRRLPESECAVCGYALKGLPEPVCPECGSDSRMRPPNANGPRGKRRVVELVCVIYLITPVWIAMTSGLSQFAWTVISDVNEWPMVFSSGDQLFRYSISANGPEYVTEGDRRGSFRSVERLYLMVSYDSYPNHDWSDPIVASVAAKFASQPQQAGRDLVADPAWSGELMVELIDRKSGDFRSLSVLDVDGLVDAVSEEYLARDGSLDPTLAMILSDPAKRHELKAPLAQAWEVGRSAELGPQLGQEQRMGHISSLLRPQSPRFVGGGMGSGGGERGAFVPAAKVGLWVTRGLGWLLTAAVLAALIRWYGRPQPQLRKLVPARLRRRSKNSGRPYDGADGGEGSSPPPPPLRSEPAPCASPSHSSPSSQESFS